MDWRLVGVRHRLFWYFGMSCRAQDFPEISATLVQQHGVVADLTSSLQDYGLIKSHRLHKADLCALNASDGARISKPVRCLP